MAETQLKYKANYYVLLLIAFVIPLSKSLAAPLIILLLITSLVNHRFGDNHKNKSSFIGILLPALLYLIYAYSLFYTQNLPNGLFKAEVKLSLLIFPLCFFISAMTLHKTIAPTLRAFVEGCFVAVLLSFIRAALMYVYTTDIVHFYYSNLSLYAHASYFSMYLCFCIAVLYWSLIASEKPLFKSYISIGLIVAFSITVGLLASKTGIGLLILIHLFVLIYSTVQTKNYIKGGMLLIAMIVLLSFFYSQSNFVQSRFSDVIQVLNMNKKDILTTSTTARLKAWETSAHLATIKPMLGYGLGSVTEVLVAEYQKRNYVKLAKRELNSHNQLFQTMLAIGLPGLICLLAMLFYPYIWYYRSKEGLYYVLFSAIILLNFTTESMLETQSGVVFYAFFNSLFFAEIIEKRLS